MDKNQTLEALERVRMAHISQMEKIMSAVNGEKIDSPTAVLKTECDFGKWLYSEESHLKKVLGSLFYNNLETAHAKWHNEYAKIFNILFVNVKKGFFSKMVGLDKIDDMELDKAKLYFSELEVTTAELLRVLDSCERRANAMNELRFL